MSPLLIREKSSKANYINHDQLFKQLIITFPKEFIEQFFPSVHDNIDFHEIKLLSEEARTDIVDGSTRRLDIVYEATLKDGATDIILHIEPQSYVQETFNQRMLHYFSLLYAKYQKLVITIAVFSYDEAWEKDYFSIELPFQNTFKYNYLTLHLRKLYWRDYLYIDNPVTAALLSKMNYKPEERVEVKKEFMLMVARLQLAPEKQRLVYGFFETYLKLTDEEEEKLMAEIEKLPESDFIQNLPISYEEKGKKIGIEKAKKEIILNMLKNNFSDELIAELTEVGVEEVKKLKEK